MKKTLLPLLFLCASLAATVPGFDRDPVFLRDFPYTPADGAVLTYNPSAFAFVRPSDWKPGKYRYVLEYAQDKDLRKAERVETDIHMVIPRKPLAPGKWFWRYGVKQPGGVQWSRVRSFTVPEKLPECAFPDLDAAIARMPKTHPRLYITREDIPAIRRRAASGDLKKWTEGMAAGMRRYIGKPLIPEPEFLPRDKTRMAVYTRIFQTTRPDQERMHNFALLYLLTGDKAFGNEAKRRLLYFFVDWDPNGSTALANNDEPARWIMKTGVPAYTWVQELFTPEERAKLETNMIVRLKQMENFFRRKPMDGCPYESHANSYLIYCLSAALTLVPEHPELKSTIEYCLTVFMAATPVWARDDGGWNEGSGYWSYYIEPIMTMVYNIRKLTGVDVAVKPFFRNTGYYPLIGWPAECRFGSFGDGYSPTNQASSLLVLGCYFDNPDFFLPAIELKRRNFYGIWNVIYEPSRIVRPDLSRLPTAWCFPGIGLAVFRNDLNRHADDVGLLLQSNPFGAVSHHHNSQNCIMLEAFGEPLLISSGYYEYYNSPHHAGWTRETKSRCGVTFDGGKGQKRGPEAKGRIARFEKHPTWDLAVGEAAAAYPGFSQAERTVVHLKPGFFVLRDRCRAKTPHVFEYNLHAFKAGTFDEAKQTVTITRPKAGLRVRFLTDKPWKFAGTMKFDIPPIRTEKQPRPDQWHFRASAPEASAEMDLLTVLLPYRTGEDGKLPEVSRTATGGVKLVWPDGRTRTVEFAPEIRVLDK